MKKTIYLALVLTLGFFLQSCLIGEGAGLWSSNQIASNYYLGYRTLSPTKQRAYIQLVLGPGMVDSIVGGIEEINGYAVDDINDILQHTGWYVQITESNAEFADFQMGETEEWLTTPGRRIYYTGYPNSCTYNARPDNSGWLTCAVDVPANTFPTNLNTKSIILWGYQYINGAQEANKDFLYSWLVPLRNARRY